MYNVFRENNSKTTDRNIFLHYLRCENIIAKPELSAIRSCPGGGVILEKQQPKKFKGDILKTINKNGHEIKVNYQVKQYFWELYEDNTWEPETFMIFDKYINKDSVYLDVGAWIGPTVLYGAQRAKKVIALEPDKQAFGYLEDNISYNPRIQNKITAINAALTAKTGPQTIYTADANSSSSLMNPHNYTHSYTIKGISLLDIYKKYHLEKIDFIKIDIEGFEYELIPDLITQLTQLGLTDIPTLYLSLHRPFYLKELTKKYSSLNLGVLAQLFAKYEIRRKTNLVARSLGVYGKIYDENGNKVDSLRKALRDNVCTSIVATNY